jgi:hypothetical protein
MKIVYIGPFESGHLGDGERSYEFKRGISTSVPDAFGAKLLAEQEEKNPQWVDEGNELADEAAKAAAEQIANKE